MTDLIYTNSLAGISSDMLDGFFTGWRTPPSPYQHLELMGQSDAVELAVDAARTRVVGFACARVDGRDQARITWLEVHPDHRRCGIGTCLLERLLARLTHVHLVELVCAPAVEPFYRRCGMTVRAGLTVRLVELDAAARR